MDVEANSPSGGARGMDVVFTDLLYTSPPQSKRGQPKLILKGVTGYFASGVMTAVMGPSGSGKTTLLDILSGRKTTGTMSGDILFGGREPSRGLLRRYCGYCEQQDTLVDSLTVEEMLLYTALLKRPHQEPLSSKRLEVQALLKKLALEECRATRIGNVLKRGISGGQAKRTNVGIALITNPALLLLDEPTSGLDSWTANEVMRVVKGILADGTTIVATIHSPSSHCFSLFQRVMVLVAGSVAYFGTTEQSSTDYFTNVLHVRPLNIGENLAEYIMDYCTQMDVDERADELAQAYKDSALMQLNLSELQELLGAAPTGAGAQACAGQDQGPGGGVTALVELPNGLPSADKARPRAQDGGPGGGAGGCLASDSWIYVAPQWYSLSVLLQYRTLRNYRSMDYLGPRMFDKIIFGLIIMALYWNTGRNFSPDNVPNMAALMYLCCAQPAWGAVAYIPTIVMERALYVREHNDGLYRPVTYLVFKMIDELSLNWVVGLASTGIIWGGARLTGSFVYFWLMLMTTLSNGVVIAYAMSALCATMDIANAVVPTLLAVMLFLSGFLIRIPAIPVYLRWLTWVNLLKYSWGGLMINQFEANPEAEIGGHPILEYYDLDSMSKWSYLGIVAAFFCFWSALAWVALAFVKHHQR